MGLSVFQRLAGTILPYFRIGQIGPTIYSGTGNPGDDDVSGNNGDIFIRYGSTPGLFQMYNDVWREQGDLSLQRSLVQSATFNATNQNYYIGVNRNGTVDLFLPAGLSGKSFVIKDEGGFASNILPITIIPQEGETIEGQSTYTIEAPRGSLTLVFGGEWHVI